MYGMYRIHLETMKAGDEAWAKHLAVRTSTTVLARPQLALRASARHRLTLAHSSRMVSGGGRKVERLTTARRLRQGPCTTTAIMRTARSLASVPFLFLRPSSYSLPTRLPTSIAGAVIVQ